MDMFRFQLGSLVHLTDPCYDAPENKGEMNFDGSGLYNVPCAEGYWIAARLPTDKFGEVARENRVVGFTLVSEDYDHQALRTKSYRVGVDSGQFGIFDASIYENDSDYDVEGSFYRTVCDITNQENCGTVFNSGFVSSSGYGDGGYDLICGFLDGKLAYASITFIEDYDDDEDDMSW
jgi:hypothetical protein